MAESKVIAPVVERNEIVDRAKGFWDKFSKPIIIVGSIVILAIVGFYIYKYYYKIPNEKKASELVFAAEKIFDKVIIAFGNNPEKDKSKSLRPKTIKNRQIAEYNGLLTDFVNSLKYGQLLQPNVPMTGPVTPDADSVTGPHVLIVAGLTPVAATATPETHESTSTV